MNREKWLNEMAQHLYKRFKSSGYEDIPEKIRFSCSLPSKGAFAKNQVLGECWSCDASDDCTFEIMISHVVSESVRAADVLAHELVHVIVGIENGHNATFGKCARAIGLEGKLTATYAGEDLTNYIKEYAQVIGEYPHASLSKPEEEKKQSTRQLKMVCRNDHPEYIARISKKTLDIAAPLCGLCHQEMVLG
ncbi:MAG: hypothetical protein HRU09_01000 [Oligoflexales bacterium]|nr:hypothetical protein [Oligoflexales bacterium]